MAASYICAHVRWRRIKTLASVAAERSRLIAANVAAKHAHSSQPATATGAGNGNPYSKFSDSQAGSGVISLPAVPELRAMRRSSGLIISTCSLTPNRYQQKEADVKLHGEIHLWSARHGPVAWRPGQDYEVGSEELLATGGDGGDIKVKPHPLAMEMGKLEAPARRKGLHHFETSPRLPLLTVGGVHRARHLAGVVPYIHVQGMSMEAGDDARRGTVFDGVADKFGQEQFCVEDQVWSEAGGVEQCADLVSQPTKALEVCDGTDGEAPGVCGRWRVRGERRIHGDSLVQRCAQRLGRATSPAWIDGCQFDLSSHQIAYPTRSLATGRSRVARYPR